MIIDENILLTRGAVYKKILKGDVIFKEGAACHFYFQLVEGSISWENYDNDGKLFVQQIIQPGECFGELPLFDGLPYAASAVANENSVILQLHEFTFNELLKERQDILFAFSKLLAIRVREKFFMLKELACHTPVEQIIALLYLYKEKSCEVLAETPLRINYTRQQIADMTGLRVETVIRVIKKLSKEGKLIIQKGKVYLPSNIDYNHNNFDS
jgi:CRP-like cAMP-binding protein